MFSRSGRAGIVERPNAARQVRHLRPQRGQQQRQVIGSHRDHPGGIHLGPRDEILQAPDDIALWQNNLTEVSIELGNLDAAEASIRETLILRQKVPDDKAAVWAQLNLARIAAGRFRFQEAERGYAQTIESATKLGMRVTPPAPIPAASASAIIVP